MKQQQQEPMAIDTTRQPQRVQLPRRPIAFIDHWLRKPPWRPFPIATHLPVEEPPRPRRPHRVEAVHRASSTQTCRQPSSSSSWQRTRLQPKPPARSSEPHRQESFQPGLEAPKLVKSAQTCSIHAQSPSQSRAIPRSRLRSHPVEQSHAHRLDQDRPQTTRHPTTSWKTSSTQQVASTPAASIHLLYRRPLWLHLATCPSSVLRHCLSRRLRHSPTAH